MLRTVLENSSIQLILGFIAFLYIRFVFWTSSWIYIGCEKLDKNITNNSPILVAFWHGQMLMMPCFWTYNTPFYMLISAHKDGRLIKKVVDFFHIKTITGSTHKRGSVALRNMLRVLKKNEAIGITPDGPQGPRHRISKGTAITALLSQCPLLPVTYSVKYKKTLKSWDTFIIPRPFNKGVFIVGKPIQPPKKKKDIQTFIKSVSEEMDTIDQIARSQVLV